MGELRAPVGLDVTVPNIARVDDFLLGGKDHYPVDREHAKRLLEVLPFIEFPQVAVVGKAAATAG